MRQSASSNPSAMNRIASISLLRVARGRMMRGFSSMCVVVAMKTPEPYNRKPRQLLGSLACEQVGFNEVVDVSAEYCFDVASFQLSASVFYQLIGRQHVTSYLRSE